MAPDVEPDRASLAASGAARAQDADARGPARAGVIKAATGLGGPGGHERRGLVAAAAAHAATGAPVSTHTERATWAVEQARFLIDGGVAAEKLLIGHCDFRLELPFLLELAASGARIGFDQFSKIKYAPDEERVRLIAELAAAGHLQQVILSGDLARRSYWPAYGHPEAGGFAHVPSTVTPLLRQVGFGDEDVDVLLRDNPQRWLAFEPR
jgi:5-phospho-D-xylono-1,4-lactonase